MACVTCLLLRNKFLCLITFKKLTNLNLKRILEEKTQNKKIRSAFSFCTGPHRLYSWQMQGNDLNYQDKIFPEITENVLWIQEKYTDYKVDDLGRKFHIIFPLLQKWILHTQVSRPHSAPIVFQNQHHYKLTLLLINSSKSRTMKHWYFCLQGTGVKEMYMVSDLRS